MISVGNLTSEQIADALELKKYQDLGGPDLTQVKVDQVSKAITALSQMGYDVDIRNGGLHLRIKHERLGDIDYWPTTQKLWCQKIKRRGQGWGVLKVLIRS